MYKMVIHVHAIPTVLRKLYVQIHTKLWEFKEDNVKMYILVQVRDNEKPIIFNSVSVLNTKIFLAGPQQ